MYRNTSATIRSSIAAGVSTLFRKQDDAPVYLQPVVLNWGFYGALLLNYTLNTAWIFIWDDEILLGAAIVLLFIAYSAWLAFAVACYRYVRVENVRRQCT